MQSLKFYLRRVFLAVSLLGISTSLKASIPDDVPICQVCLSSQSHALLRHLNRLEGFYQLYRWGEFKMRDLYYHELWQARHRQLDPLSKEERKKGQEDEELLKPEQLEDYLFLMDYKINYEIIFRITHPAKLKNKDTVLQDICERIAPESALAQLFYGITRKKLGDDTEASNRAVIAKRLVDQSAYWQKRFDVLDLYALLEQIK